MEINIAAIREERQKLAEKLKKLDEWLKLSRELCAHDWITTGHIGGGRTGKVCRVCGKEDWE